MGSRRGRSERAELEGRIKGVQGWRGEGVYRGGEEEGWRGEGLLYHTGGVGGDGGAVR